MLSKKVEEKQYKPVIVLGAARSGTKLLRDIISSSSLCYHIPYDINYVWRFGNEEYLHDALPSDCCEKKVSQYIRKVLPKLAGIRNNDFNNYLVEKTVSNTLRVDFIRKIFPNAIFIHIIRDGRDVIESSFRMWNEDPNLKYLIKKLRYFPISNVRYATWYLKNMLLKNNSKFKIWGPRYPGIYEDLENYSMIEVCAKQWSECVRYAQGGLSSVPISNKLTVYFEELVSSEDEIKRICDFLKLSDEQSVIDYYNYNVRSDVIGKWKNVNNEQDMQKANKIIEPLMSKLGYIS